MTTPRQRFRYKKAFSTNLLILYAFWSYFLWIFRGGITTFMPKFSAESLRRQYFWAVHLSDGLPSASETTLSTSSPAFAQSAVTPSVTTHRTGTPRASTARCILVLSPLLCARFPGFPLSLHRHACALSRSLHQS